MREAFWIIDQLVQQGVNHFFIAPGSRSTPLALTAADHPDAKIHIHFDERGLGFYALGLSKASQQPTALIVTSGTAVANLLPSVMEAHHTSTPLILLTADRPPELRDCGANQTTDQLKIFQSFVRWQVDLPCSLDQERTYRSSAAQAFFFATQNPPGPVTINCPFREPLYQPFYSYEKGAKIPLTLPRHISKPLYKNVTRGLILIGRLPHPSEIHPILKLAEKLNWPVCGDILSNARLFPSPQQINHFDWMEKPTPDLILHFGERMTSKRILEWITQFKSEYIHVSPWPFLQDPNRLLTERVQSDIPEFCCSFNAESDPSWLSLWKKLDQDPWIEDTLWTEAHAIRNISNLIPQDFGVFLGNGMPIRDADHFLFPKHCRGFFSNRGVSGIDGNIATLAGLAETMPMIAIIGDQAALYDLNSLPLLNKTKFPVTLIVSNNFGGGIFSHLPLRDTPHFETLFAASHNWNFENVAKMFDLPYLPLSDLESALAQKRSTLIELFTDRKKNFAFHQKIKESCSLVHF